MIAIAAALAGFGVLSSVGYFSRRIEEAKGMREGLEKIPIWRFAENACFAVGATMIVAALLILIVPKMRGPAAVPK